MKRLYSVSLWATVVYAAYVTGCSSEKFLSAPIFAGKQIQLNEGGVKNGDGRGREDDDDERELPPTEVAGANLVGECYALEDGPLDSSNGRVDCTVTSSDGPREVVAHTAKIFMADTVWTGVTSGRPTGVANTYFVSAAVPLSVSFVVPKDTIASMNQKHVRVTFAVFGVGGQEPRQDFEMRMEVRKKRVLADARCQEQNYDMETTSDAGSVRFQLFSAINPRDGLSLTTLQKERKVSLINESISTWSGCDFAVDLAGNGFKADGKVDGERGFVLIRDTSTNHTWTVFSNIDGYHVDVTSAQLPSVSFARPAHCRNKPANDEGKWICSDYFNIFADDLRSGRKVVEIFATSGFNSKKLHLKTKK